LITNSNSFIKRKKKSISPSSCGFQLFEIEKRNIISNTKGGKEVLSKHLLPFLDFSTDHNSKEFISLNAQGWSNDEEYL
jgi:hypothetical protein